MKPARVAFVASLIAIAISGCGGSSKSSAGTTAKTTTGPRGTGSAALTAPPGTPAALRGARGVDGGVLRAGELAGFVPQGFSAPSTSAQSDVAEFPPERRAPEAARIKALGFVSGITERLAPAKGAGTSEEAVSLVVQFRSARGASGEVADQLKQATGRGENTFAVPGIPGARGFGVASSPSAPGDANIAFAVGDYYYLVGFSSHTATRAQLITAAQTLYRRLRG